MLKLKKIAITGGISCGKSTVSRIFQELGAYVIDADRIVHQLLTPETEFGKKAIELLGKSVVVEGKIDRTRVARKVFLNPRLLRSLEDLAHPLVYEEINRQYQEICENNTKEIKLFAAEVPLLFESKGEQHFDETIAIIADLQTCWERYRKSTGHEREDFNRRMARQLPQEEKAKRADYVIHNDGTLQELHDEIETIFNKICETQAKNKK